MSLLLTELEKFRSFDKCGLSPEVKEVAIVIYSPDSNRILGTIAKINELTWSYVACLHLKSLSYGSLPNSRLNNKDVSM